MLDAYIINHNQLTWTKGIVHELKNRLGCNPIILDNNSSYEPLLAWYESHPCEVVRLDRNYGSRAPWLSEVVKLKEQRQYIVTDPDLDLSTLPKDTVKVMLEALERYRDVVKVGVSLRIDDLPEHFPLKEYFTKWESAFWNKPLSPIHYEAFVDTTFAVYAGERLTGLRGEEFHRAIRLAPPYTAQHLPWYLDPNKLTEEELYMLRSSEESVVWKDILLYDGRKLLPKNDKLNHRMKLLEVRLDTIREHSGNIDDQTILIYGDRSGVLPYLFRRDRAKTSNFKLVCCIDTPDTCPEASRLFTDLDVKWIVADPFSDVPDEIPVFTVIQATSLEHAVRSLLRFSLRNPKKIMIFIDQATNHTYQALELCAHEAVGARYNLKLSANYLLLDLK